LKKIRELISAEQIAARIREMGQQIARDYENRELVLVSVLKGSFIFLADLARAIPSHRISIEFLGVASYGNETQSSGVVQITSDLTRPIDGKDVLIVEDIVDTGLTMSYIAENFQTRHPASVKLAALLHKPTRTKAACTVDYLGFTIDDLFVVGYGLDYAQHYRNLPFIGVIQ
jgi:hypoxanthine phosphoribosyltransferase